MSTSQADQHVCFAQNILLHRGVGIELLFILTLLLGPFCARGNVRFQCVTDEV